MKSFLSSLSLRFRIAFTFTVSIIILLTAVLIIVGTETASDFRKRQNQQYEDLAQARAEQVGEVIAKNTTVLNVIANDGGFYSPDPKVVQNTLDQYKRMNSITSESPYVSFIWPDGKGYTSLGNTVDVKEREYIQTLLAGAVDFVISPPIISKSTGQPSVNFAKLLRRPDRSIQGILQLSVNLAKLSNITNSIKAEKTGYGWICDQTGLVIAYPQQDQIMKLNISDADTQGYSGINDFTKKMLTSKEGFGTWYKQGQHMIAFYAQIPGSSGWYMGLAMPISEINETINFILTILVFLLVIGIILAMIISILLSNTIIHPIKLTAASFQELAQGEADLTKQIKIIRNDEIGKLTKDFNTFVKKLHEIISSLKDSQGGISKIAVNLSNSSEETVATVMQISTNINHVSNQTRLQTESVISSSAAVEEIAKNIESLDRIISDQVASVTQASAAIEQMARNIDSVFNSIENLSTEYQELTHDAENGKEAREKSEVLIGEIFKRSSSLQEANYSISNIASQTNLLAMNAAIEAAHAGQSGKGFAVVADEIRKLAENSSLQSKTITKDIEEVQNSISELVKTSQDLGSILGRVESKINHTKTIVSEVHSAMSEQQVGSKQMLEALENLNNLSVAVKSGSEEMKNGNTTLVYETNQLRATSQQVQESIDQIAKGTEQLNNSAKNSATMAEHTKEAVFAMDQAVGRFKI